MTARPAPWSTMDLRIRIMDKEQIKAEIEALDRLLKEYMVRPTIDDAHRIGAHMGRIMKLVDAVPMPMSAHPHSPTVGDQEN